MKKVINKRDLIKEMYDEGTTVVMSMRDRIDLAKEMCDEYTAEVMKLDSQIPKLKSPKRKIEKEIKKLERYIKSGGKKKLIFIKYIDVNEFRKLEIENKLQAEANIIEMEQILLNIRRVLLEKGIRRNFLKQELYIFSLFITSQNKVA